MKFIFLTAAFLSEKVSSVTLAAYFTTLKGPNGASYFCYLFI
jgi:hypothetical protein